ncbi:MAG TPA: hypothetical protein PLZ92_10795 [Phycicoccus sp.]|nr:hypothetical protein [Phycicoccus sp.]HQK32154.1 hypothetical protein [Phycicoccus sp.]
MRAVLILPTPGKTLSEQEAVEALHGTSWLPSQEASSEHWRIEQIERLRKHLPTAVQAQLALSPCLFIQVGNSVEGLVSIEREEAVVIRLFETTDSLDSIKEAVSKVASALPGAFVKASGSDSELRLDDEVVIRQSNDGRTIAKGVIVTPHTLRFQSYLRAERSRERRLLAWLTILALVSAVFPLLPLFYGWSGVVVNEMQGYGERVASALVVAVLTTVINLVFEYRDWRNEKTEVQWLFG